MFCSAGSIAIGVKRETPGHIHAPSLVGGHSHDTALSWPYPSRFATAQRRWGWRRGGGSPTLLVACGGAGGLLSAGNKAQPSSLPIQTPTQASSPSPRCVPLPSMHRWNAVSIAKGLESAAKLPRTVVCDAPVAACRALTPSPIRH
ncbi:hypothetical protein K402DRAFT_184171 [Aulographum hederae CBS 113979]|uniref:Uncharacterized protein n=1 Tax=Aulographum hederae CBS 113979 TaxID=1176131 RepID=A0A6G1GQ72_9PEZI|nr:hypothetical protein K402DRAFT_184171 [Aulographum hederae CBS 113979]